MEPKSIPPRQMDMLHGSLLDKLLLFALPLALSSILQQLFTAADVAVVGRFAGSQALAAVGSNTSVISLMINLFVGLSVGANVVIARLIGLKQRDEVRGAVHTVIALALASGVFLLLLGLFFARPILTAMNTPADVLEQAVLYLRLYFLGMPFLMLYNFGSAILRSKGDTRRPLYCLMLSGVINVLLNLLLVIVYRLGVAGVAIATVLSNALSASLMLRFLTHEEPWLRLSLRRLRFRRHDLWMILQIGAPAGLQGMVFSFSNVCIQAAVNGFGSAASAGSSAAMNLEYFIYFTISAFGQAAVTFTSQNYAAGDYVRCRRILRLSMLGSVLFSGLLIAFFLLFRLPLLRLYSTDPTVLAFAVSRLTHIIVAEWLATFYEVPGGALRGMGYSMLPAALTVLGSCVFRLLWITTLFRVFPTYENLMIVYPISWILTGTTMLIAYFVLFRRAVPSDNRVSASP